MNQQSQTLKTAWDDDLMLPAFLSCLHWALGEPAIIDRYRAETGDAFAPAANGLERMIDRATGNDLAFLQRFSDWVEVNIFGRPEDVYSDGDAA